MVNFFLFASASGTRHEPATPGHASQPASGGRIGLWSDRRIELASHNESVNRDRKHMDQKTSQTYGKAVGNHAYGSEKVFYVTSKIFDWAGEYAYKAKEKLGRVAPQHVNTAIVNCRLKLDEHSSESEGLGKLVRLS